MGFLHFVALLLSPSLYVAPFFCRNAVVLPVQTEGMVVPNVGELCLLAVYVQYVLGHLGAYEKEEKVIG